MPSDTIGPEYTQKPGSGFRYRLLDINTDADYSTIIAELLPGEMLYRMMDGQHRTAGDLFPVKMDSESELRSSINRWGLSAFKLAAGIPAPISSKEKTKT